MSVFGACQAPAPSETLPRMVRPNPRALLRAARDYVKEHPDELVRAARNALKLRVGVPLDALRYVVREFVGGPKVPKDIEFQSAEPGLRVSMTVDAVGSKLRVSLVVTVDSLELAPDRLEVAVRVTELTLKLLEGKDTPVAALIQSGALDLSKPGNLVAFIPKRPAMIVDAKDDRIVIDAMKVPKIAANERLRKALAIAKPVVGIRAIRCEDDHLDVHLRACLSGVPDAVAEARR
jgi:hypothetical protein